VSSVIGNIEKKTIVITRNCFGRQRNFDGEHLWAKSFYVSTFGRDEVVIRN
jgi:putative transposase